MRSAAFFLVLIALAAFAGSGCWGGRGSDYPDHNPGTTRRVDDIKRNARDRKDAIDLEYDELSNSLDFRERQIRERYRAERETHAVETSKAGTDLSAKRRELELQAKYDKDKIDAETAEKLRTSPAEEAESIRTDAASRKAEIDSQLAQKLTPILRDLEHGESDVRQRRLEIDLKEAKEISNLEKERAQAREQMRAKRVEVDRWTTEELGKVEQDAGAAKR